MNKPVSQYVNMNYIGIAAAALSILVSFWNIRRYYQAANK
jgi:hypothetical protein